MAEIEVVVTGVREMIARLKELDPKQVAKMRKELRESTNKVASDIRTGIGVTPPIKGMGGFDHRTDFGGAVTSVKISVAGSTRKNITPLLKIKVDAPKNAVGYLIAEFAGKRGGAGETPQGSNLIAVLTDRLGVIKGKGKGAQRGIAWRHFWAQRRELNRAAAEIIARYEIEATRELNS